MSSFQGCPVHASIHARMYMCASTYSISLDKFEMQENYSPIYYEENLIRI